MGSDPGQRKQVKWPLSRKGQQKALLGEAWVGGPHSRISSKGCFSQKERAKYSLTKKAGHCKQTSLNTRTMSTSRNQGTRGKSSNHMLAPGLWKETPTRIEPNPNKREPI